MKKKLLATEAAASLHYAEQARNRSCGGTQEDKNALQRTHAAKAADRRKKRATEAADADHATEATDPTKKRAA